MSRDCIVLGIDPGSRCTGYGVVAETSGQAALVETGTIRPVAEDGLSFRLGFIFSRLTELLDRFTPDVVAVEDVFFSRNSASALKLGQARGAILAACGVREIPVHGYEPALVKKSLVGTGRAEKDQVAFMVGQILGQRPDWARDSSDALAVAICHLNQRRYRRLCRQVPG
jgi:crossover junction endodeoxyribonuclease RuvC